jgi:hypothetical protein
MHVSPERKTMIRQSIGKALEKDKLELAIKLADLLGLPDKELVLTKRPLLPNQENKEIFTKIIPAFPKIVSKKY